jgi:hypothetical protein
VKRPKKTNGTRQFVPAAMSPESTRPVSPPTTEAAIQPPTFGPEVASLK